MRSSKTSRRPEVGFGFLVGLLAWCAIAQAHTHLLKSVPADGQVLEGPPLNVTLTFSEACRLTAAWIQKGEGAKTRLMAPEKTATAVTIALPALTPGTYLMSWRAASADGHVMPGRIRFTVSAGAAAQGERR